MSKPTFKKTRMTIEPPIVAPLGTPTRRRGFRIAPVARRLLWGSLMVAVGLRLGAIAVEPIRAGYLASCEIRVLEAEEQRVHGRNQQLHRLKRYLETPAGIEEEARRQGFVRQGERPIRLVRASPDLPASASPPHGPSERAAVPGYADGPATPPPASAPAPSPTPSPRSNTAETIQQFLGHAARWIAGICGGGTGRRSSPS